MDAMVPQALSLGISGLLFVMWWYERQDRLAAAAAAADARDDGARLGALNGELLEVLRSNTAALSGLREELKSQRAIHTELLGRISHSLERLHAA